MKYTAKGTHNRHFELLDETGAQAGKLDYNLWYSRRKAVMLAGGKEYDIEPTGVLNTTIALSLGEERLYTLKFNWKGQIVIAKEGGASYVFKRVGLFGGHYGLFTEHEMEIVMLKQHYEFTAWSFSYEIETDNNYAEGRDAMLMLLLVYSMNYMHTMAGAV